MKPKITYFRIHLFFGVVAAINLLTITISRLYWPTLPGFPYMVEGHPWLSLSLQVALVTVGWAVQVWLRNRPTYMRSKMVIYALTMGVALVAIFEGIDRLIGIVRSS
jgi:type IV secretory pathway TraG/TraD family ATPase VirD4